MKIVSKAEVINSTYLVTFIDFNIFVYISLYNIINWKINRAFAFSMLLFLNVYILKAIKPIDLML